MSKVTGKKMWIADNGDGTYTNPILYTDYSDPDVIRVGEDYFLVASSFCLAVQQRMKQIWKQIPFRD